MEFGNQSPPHFCGAIAEKGGDEKLRGTNQKQKYHVQTSDGRIFKVWNKGFVLQKLKKKKIKAMAILLFLGALLSETGLKKIIFQCVALEIRDALEPPRR